MTNSSFIEMTCVTGDVHKDEESLDSFDQVFHPVGAV